MNNNDLQRQDMRGLPPMTASQNMQIPPPVGPPNSFPSSYNVPTYAPPYGQQTLPMPANYMNNQMMQPLPPMQTILGQDRGVNNAAATPPPQGAYSTSTKRHASSGLAGEPPAKKKQSKWSAEEDRAIIELRGNSMKWEDISRNLVGRSAISCRLRFQNYLERRSEWDEEKKNKLARLYERFKKDMWEKIAKEMALPWRAAEAMHWQIGEVEMASRANVPVFHLAGYSPSQPSQSSYSGSGLNSANTTGLGATDMRSDGSDSPGSVEDPAYPSYGEMPRDRTVRQQSQPRNPSIHDLDDRNGMRRSPRAYVGGYDSAMSSMAGDPNQVLMGAKQYLAPFVKPEEANGVAADDRKSPYQR